MVESAPAHVLLASFCATALLSDASAPTRLPVSVEIRLLSPMSAAKRPDVSELSAEVVAFLDQLIAITLAGLTVSYAIYSITSPTAVQHPALVVTLPNVLYGVFRYLYLIQIQHKGGSPESILLEDRPLQICLLLWFLEVAIAFKL